MNTIEYKSTNILTGVDLAGFSKLFNTMWGGSLYGRFEASATFMVLLSLCDRNGVVDMTPEAIAGTTGWPIAFIRKGISELISPDPRSRTPDEEGRRLVAIDEHRDWGWRITTYQKHRDEMRSIERTEYLRLAKQKERSRNYVNTVNKSTNVNTDQPIAEAEAEAEADTKTKLLAQRDKRASLGDAEIVEKIPALGGTEVEIRESHVKELERLYPAVDVPQTLREIRAWNLD